MAVPTPSTLSMYGDALRTPTVEGVHWAGTETATQWMGYMEGALQSGERAAAEVVAALRAASGGSGGGAAGGGSSDE